MATCCKTTVVANRQRFFLLLDNSESLLNGTNNVCLPTSNSIRVTAVMFFFESRPISAVRAMCIAEVRRLHGCGGCISMAYLHYCICGSRGWWGSSTVHCGCKGCWARWEWGAGWGEVPAFSRCSPISDNAAAVCKDNQKTDTKSKIHQ